MNNVIFITLSRALVAPQLTVISAPALNKAFTLLRGTPTVLGWGPTGRRHVIRQEFSHTPAMLCNTSSHRRCCCASGAETCMRGTKIIDRPHEGHPVLQRHGATCQRPAAACQGGQPFSERRIQPFDGGRVDHPGALRAVSQGLDAGRCPRDDAALDIDDAPLRVALDHLRYADMAPGAPPRAPWRSRMYGLTKRLAHRPDGGAQP